MGFPVALGILKMVDKDRCPVSLDKNGWDMSPEHSSNQNQYHNLLVQWIKTWTAVHLGNCIDFKSTVNISGQNLACSLIKRN